MRCRNICPQHRAGDLAMLPKNVYLYTPSRPQAPDIPLTPRAGQCRHEMDVARVALQEHLRDTR